MRIVSLPPGATDLVADLGLGADVVAGVDDVARAVSPPAPDTPLVDGVAAHDHVTSYVFDRDALAAVRPEAILTEEVCPRCRATYLPLADGVAVAETTLDGRRVPVVTFNPRRLEDALAPIVPVATLLGQPERGERLLHVRSARLLALQMHVARHLVRSAGQRPSVALLRVDDAGLSAPGRWFPDLVDAAGGVPLLAEPGGADVWVTPAVVESAHPDLLIVGADDLDRATGAVDSLGRGGAPVWALLLDGLFTSPGPRLVEAVEVLLRLISPQALGANGTPPPDSRARRI